VKWDGYKRVRLSSIVVPGDVRGRMKDAHVVELAESIREYGQEPIHAPVVDVDGGNKLVAGRDRIAALMILKTKTVWVRLGSEMSAEDIEGVEIEENLRRRQDDRNALIARKVARKSAQIQESQTSIPDNCPESPRQGGAKKTARGAAREQVARELGTTPEAIRKAERRATEKASPKGAPGRYRNDQLPESMRHWYRELPTIALQDEAASSIANLERFAELLVQAQGSLTKIQLTAYGSHVHQRLYADAHALAEKARALKPVAVCPACQAGNSALCQLCKGLSVVTQAQLDANKPKAKAATKPTGKKNTIVLADGEVFDPAEEGGDF
jgi:ParB-like chromosome segregation protein Spo0J